MFFVFEYDVTTGAPNSRRLQPHNWALYEHSLLAVSAHRETLHLLKGFTKRRVV
jgi:hypothetical protein